MCELAPAMQSVALCRDEVSGCTKNWILKLQSQYFAMVPVRHFQWMDEEWTNDCEWQCLVLGATIHHELSMRYPPGLAYRRNFLKTLIQKCEEKLYEVSEEVYDAYILLLKEVSCTDDVNCYKTYIVNSSAQVTLKESTRLISNGTTGLRTWEAAFALAEWCITNKEHLNKRNILELGCGTGFTGLVVTQVCNPSVYCFTDVHNDVLGQLRENILLNSTSAVLDGSNSLKEVVNLQENKTNKSGSSVHEQFIQFTDGPTEIIAKVLDWRRSMASLFKDFDIILASDVVYDVTIIPDLVQVLVQFLDHHNVETRVAYIACTVRNEDTLKHFLMSLDAAKLTHMEIKDALPQIFYYERSVPVKLWKLTKKTSRSVTS